MTTTFEPVSKAGVRSLIEGPPGLRISLYLPVPTHPGFDEVRKFPQSYRAAVKEALERMAALGVDTRKAEGAARRLEDRGPDLASLPPAAHAVVVFLGPDRLRRFALAQEVGASVYVGRTFHVRPLIAGMHLDVGYRVVSLATDRVTLFEGDAWSLRRIEGDRVPASLAEALGSELSEESLQFHPGSKGSSALIHHGHGGANGERALDKHRFHQVLASALRKAWSDRDDPIVLVADRAHAGRFRGIADLPGLLDEGVVVNPEGVSDEELHERTFAVVRAWLAARDRLALERARAGVGRGQATEELTTAAEMAAAGGVASVFVVPDAHVAKHVDAATGKLHEPLGDEDALDELCAMVLTHGGRVRVLDAQGAEDAPPLVAELRH